MDEQIKLTRSCKKIIIIWNNKRIKKIKFQQNLRVDFLEDEKALKEIICVDL